MLFRLSVAVAALTLAATSAGAVELVTNGNFSTPDVGGGYGIFSLADTGWSNLNDSGVEIGSTPIYGLPCGSAGCQNLEVNANTFGDVVQTITGLTAGAKYVLTYAYGGRPGYGPQILDVNFDGGRVSTDSGSFGVFTPYKYVVTASGTSAVLEFKSEITTGSPGGGNEITDVSLMAVPEPASWALMVAGFGLVGVAARRRVAVAA